ncbi:hypothetical protein HYE82_23275 [Streptomyces sp. BR123]|uniref:hypothetical protein n=1 Tax=Streptomyces sp. BR123 TaxID=2749828 RepID=UPI0015C4D78B|nr:hypothetical protein [Streptomyces sp. BR123]NXY97244.1 hypothetical protein [Streptomyces sp. BR123]
MSQSDLPRPRRRRRLRTAAGLCVLLALVGYLVVRFDSMGGGGAPHCTASDLAEDAPGGESRRTYDMTPEQAANAATIAAVGVAKGLPDRAVTIALATAMQESALRNLNHGDRDSLGLFQQRPSQGWGTPEQIRDPVYSAGIFYDRLVKVKGYSRLPLTEAAQKVQLSGYPQAYAKHEPDATVLTAAFAGAGEVTCGGPAPTDPGDPEKVRAELSRIFAKTGLHSSPAEPARTAGGPGGIEEREISVVEKQDGGEPALRGSRAMAGWAVANARGMNIVRVSYDRRGWIAGQKKGRWQDTGGSGKSGDTDPHNATPGEIRIFVKR